MTPDMENSKFLTLITFQDEQTDLNMIFEFFLTLVKINYCKYFNNQGPSVKDVRPQGRGGFFRCGRPHILMQKTSDFSKFMVCPHGQGGRGFEPVRTFCEQGDQFFAFMCRRPLWMAPYSNNMNRLFV